MRKERGLSLVNVVLWLAGIGIVGLGAAKLMPAYLEFANVKKVLAGMEQAGETKGTVREIRYAFEKRNAIEDIRSIRGEDLEITKEAGETIVTASWSVKVPMVYNINACLDFTATTAKQ